MCWSALMFIMPFCIVVHVFLFIWTADISVYVMLKLDVTSARSAMFFVHLFFPCYKFPQPGAWETTAWTPSYWELQQLTSWQRILGRYRSERMWGNQFVNSSIRAGTKGSVLLSLPGPDHRNTVCDPFSFLFLFKRMTKSITCFVINCD